MTISTHNTQLTKLLSEIKSRTALANDKAALVAIIDSVIRFKKPLKYNYSRFFHAIIICSIICVLGFAAQQSDWLALTFAGYWWLVPPIVCIVITLIVYATRRSSINELQKTLYFKKLLFDNQLQSIAFTSKDKASELGIRFQDFRRGNHLREIESLYQGTYQGTQKTFTYQLYRFHYVNRRTVTETYSDSNGKTRTRTRTVYDHYYRHGLLFDFKHFPESRLSVVGYDLPAYGERYKPASNAFNRLFSVYADTALIGARFCKPRIIEIMTSLAQQLHRINLEVDRTGAACLSFADDTLLSHDSRYGFDCPREFKQEIAAHTELRQLKKVVSLIEQLHVHSDSNF